MKQLITIVLLICLGFVACKDKDDPEPTVSAKFEVRAMRGYNKDGSTGPITVRLQGHFNNVPFDDTMTITGHDTAVAGSWVEIVGGNDKTNVPMHFELSSQDTSSWELMIYKSDKYYGLVGSISPKSFYAFTDTIQFGK